MTPSLSIVWIHLHWLRYTIAINRVGAFHPQTARNQILFNSFPSLPKTFFPLPPPLLHLICSPKLHSSYSPSSFFYFIIIVVDYYYNQEFYTHYCCVSHITQPNLGLYLTSLHFFLFSVVVQTFSIFFVFIVKTFQYINSIEVPSPVLRPIALYLECLVVNSVNFQSMNSV